MSSLSFDDVTVLHVDDEPGFTELVTNFLERADSALSIQEATNVDDALGILETEDVDCIVSDYDMPGTDGLEFLELVRSEHPDLPFILFTGRGSEQIASEAISAGVTEYLQKEGGTDQYEILANRIRNSVQGVRAEAAMHRTEERYHNLVDSAPIPIVLFNHDARAVYSNEAAVEFLDADSHAQIEGKPFTEFLHPDDRGAAHDRMGRLLAEDRSLPEREFRIRTCDGDFISATIATAHGYYHDEEVAQVMAYR